MPLRQVKPQAAEYFEDLPLDRRSLRTLERIGYERPTPIQAAFIPIASSGRDCIGQAQTGTGKTAAFLLPIIERLHPEILDPAALVLAPTRELAVQIHDEAERLSQGRGLAHVTLVGGHPLRPQIKELHYGCHIAIGTPGRVMHFLRTGDLRVHEIRHVVLDEADRMLDIGFRPDIEKILRQLPKDRQTMLLSATMEPPVRRLAARYMVDPVMVEIPKEQLTVGTIRQSHFVVDRYRKFDLLLRLIDRDWPERCLIFCRRKRDADDVAGDLGRHHVDVQAMHGDLDQRRRNTTLDEFRSGRIRFLISTDLVGRGIDVDDITHVINYDIPDDPENYVHRIGRTARMGKDGIAYTFVQPEQANELTAIEILINKLIEPDKITGFDAVGPGGAERRTQRPRSAAGGPRRPKRR